MNNIYQKITQNNQIFELSSAYCHLLYHVCCDENVKVKGYYEPRNFKNVISWKNPLFKGLLVGKILCLKALMQMIQKI